MEHISHHIEYIHAILCGLAADNSLSCADFSNELLPKIVLGEEYKAPFYRKKRTIFMVQQNMASSSNLWAAATGWFDIC